MRGETAKVFNSEIIYKPVELSVNSLQQRKYLSRFTNGAPSGETRNTVLQEGTEHKLSSTRETNDNWHFIGQYSLGKHDRGFGEKIGYWFTFERHWTRITRTGKLSQTRLGPDQQIIFFVALLASVQSITYLRRKQRRDDGSRPHRRRHDFIVATTDKAVVDEECERHNDKESRDDASKDDG